MSGKIRPVKKVETFSCITQAIGYFRYMTTTHRSIAAIEADIKAATIKRNNFRQVINEGQGGFLDDSEITRLAVELVAAQAAASPLLTNLAQEKAWFNAQGFTGKNLAAANAACQKRGYSLSDLQAACKSSK